MKQLIEFVNNTSIEELVFWGMVSVIAVVAIIKYIREELKED